MVLLFLLPPGDDESRRFAVSPSRRGLESSSFSSPRVVLQTPGDEDAEKERDTKVHVARVTMPNSRVARVERAGAVWQQRQAGGEKEFPQAKNFCENLLDAAPSPVSLPVFLYPEDSWATTSLATEV